MTVWQSNKMAGGAIIGLIYSRLLMGRIAGRPTHQQVKKNRGQIDLEWWPAISNSDYHQPDLPFFSARSGENIPNRHLVVWLSDRFLSYFKTSSERDSYLI